MNTWQPPVTRYECPIESCDWVHDVAGPEPVYGATIDESVRNTMLAHVARIESALGAHLKTHPLLDWLTEVVRLQAKIQGGTLDALLVTAVLVHKLGGGVYISDRDLLDHSGKLLQREPVSNGFVLSVASAPSTGAPSGG